MKRISHKYKKGVFSYNGQTKIITVIILSLPLDGPFKVFNYHVNGSIIIEIAFYEEKNLNGGCIYPYFSKYPAETQDNNNE